jgi:predicted DNA-binding transcriptional regulator YafY
VDNLEGRLRWGPEQRLEFIEFRLFWDGWINRSDIIERFGVSVPQASNDLTQYREMAPDNLQYDSSAKRYLATTTFEPVLLKPNPDRYLAQLKAIVDDVMQVEDTWMAMPPTADAMPIPTRKIDAKILRAFAQAISSNKGVTVFYHSMSAERPKAIWRKISPHAFVFDGLRWHVRAFCHLSQEFKDFLLSRCTEIGIIDDQGSDVAKDWKWNTVFEVILKPNPALTESQQQAVAWDYNMTSGQVAVPVRLALLYYFNKRLRFDVAEQLDRVQERHVVIHNYDEFQRALQSVAT